ncbi:hypothetical protein [Arthrobacter sp. MDT1-65]
MTTPSDAEVVTSFSGLLDRARNAGTHAAAAVVQGKLDELTAGGACEETREALHRLIREIFGFENLPTPDAPLNTVAHVQRETLAALALHVSHGTWTQLTTEQKECFSNAMDAEWDWDPDSTRVDRWWRDKA